MIRLTGLGWILAVVASGCSGVSLIGDVGSDPGANQGQCHGALADSGCLPTWEQASTMPDCQLPPGVLHLGHAAGFLARAVGGGYVAWACYYDAATHALVGGWAASDLPNFCGNTSFDIIYGSATQAAINGFQPDLDPAPVCPADGGTP